MRLTKAYVGAAIRAQPAHCCCIFWCSPALGSFHTLL